MRRVKTSSLEKRQSRNGFLFVLPWLIGFLLFFFLPILQSITFVFSKVSITTNGFALDFIGLENIKYSFLESPQYVDNLVETIGSFAYQIPIVMILSMIIGIVLNPKFRGRTFFRSLFFVPVIIATGVVMTYLTGDSTMEQMRNASSNGAASSVYMSGLIDFQRVFFQLGLPDKAISLVMSYVNDIFDLVWKCGIQILLFISGLQTIPDQLYEVSKVEGASKWEEFWYITIPSLGNTIVLVLVYTAIDFCISNENKVMDQAYTILLEQQTYGQSAAMMWMYFIIVCVIMVVVYALFRNYCLKRWEN